MQLSRRQALVTMAAALSGCRAERRTHDDALELAIDSEPGSLDPRFPSDIYALRIARLCFATLLQPNADTVTPEPWLAERAEDDESGGVLLELHAEACFHDGTPIRARDVLATLDALSDARLASPYARVLQQLQAKALDGPDGRRVHVTSRTPRATLRADLEFPILKATEAGLPRDAALTGSGPFRVTRTGAGTLSLVPSDAYSRWHAPARQVVVVRTVRDEAARALRLLGARTDIASNVLSPPLARALPLRHDAPAGLQLVTRESTATTFLVVQCTRAPFAAPELRHALSLALDRQALVEAKLAGAATIARGFLPPALATGSHPTFAFAPDEARRLLAAVANRGHRIELLVASDRVRVATARAIAQMLGDVGLPTDVRTLEFATFLARLGTGDFDLALLIASEVTDPDVLRWYLHSTSIPPRAANRARFADRTVDALLDTGLATFDRGKRAALYEELEARLREQLPMLPLWHPQHVALTSARAHGFAPSVDGRWGALARL